MAPQIRKGRPEDCRQIYEAHKEAIEVSCARAYTPEQISQWTGVLRVERYQDGMEEGVLLVAEDEGRIMGFGLVLPEKEELAALYLAPAAQGLGLGSRLLAGLEQAARKEGLELLRLNAALNAAPFYRAKGWRDKGPVTEISRNGLTLPCIAFEKNLS